MSMKTFVTDAHGSQLYQWNTQSHKVGIVDFGCAECKFLLRAREALKSVKTIVGVDTDECLLHRSTFTLEPFSHWESLPVVYLYKGSVADYDYRADNADAVVAIELIEHLHDDVLRRGVENIFSRLQPYLVVFTTPNVEFNVLFDMGDRRYRHDDHKFEWNRQEFQTWCKNIVKKYPKYRVEFRGIGSGPDGRESEIGHCSQMATFRWRSRTAYEILKKEKIQRFWNYVQSSSPCDVSTNSCRMENETHAFRRVYAQVARIANTPDVVQRKIDKNVVSACQNYCRTQYHARRDFDAKNVDPSEYPVPFTSIVVHPGTQTHGIWFDINELLKLSAVERFFSSANELEILLSQQPYFVRESNGFDCSSNSQIFYQDEDEIEAKKAQEDCYENSDDEPEYDPVENFEIPQEGNQETLIAEIS